jgi:transposase
MAKKYIVDLKKDEQEMLTGLIASGTQRVRKINHAHILLKAGENWTDQRIGEALDVSVLTIERVRQRFVEEGLQQALSPRKTRRKYRHLMDGIQEAHLLALACSQPPKGHRRWSLRLLASEMVRLEYIEEVSHATVGHVMQDNELKPWLREEWCIPPKQNAEFVYHMEDVLEVYQRPEDARFPLICFDETPVQLISEKRQSIPTQKGHPARYDYEYRREGTANLFMFFAPLLNWRHIKVTDQRTQMDWATCIDDLVHQYFPNSERCVLVEDQLNTHTPSALYKAFEPAKARSILDRLELHFTPKHGSWLNMAEIEFSVLSRQCLNGYSRVENFWQAKRWRGKQSETRIGLQSIGVSQMPMHVSN